MKNREIRKMINIFLDGIVSAGNDAGWSGQNILARVIEFGGDVPRGTNQDQSNAAMVRALEEYRPKHKDFDLIERCVWSLLHKPEHRRHVMALLVEHYYHGIDDRTAKVFDQKGKISRWVEHCNRFPWEDQALLDAHEGTINTMYRYAVYERAPKLIAKTLKKKTGNPVLVD
jgi:hypothetical protein|tara:strand:+ start:86 stop:601 length:516 start_codon:yes stop_codon:yes gene_type:complete